MASALMGEFLGTMILILLGDGVVAAVLLKKSKAENSGWMVITAGWAFAVMAGVFTAVACGSADAHLNPAVTLGFAMRDGEFAKFAPYFLAQMLGAMVGGALVWLHYLPHWKETADAGAKLGCPPEAEEFVNGTVTVKGAQVQAIPLVEVTEAAYRQRIRELHRYY